MNWDDDVLVAVLTVTATVVAASPGWWPALAAAGRPSRLRRDEAVWRQILELGDAQESRDRQVRALHRHTAAQLVSLRLVPVIMLHQVARLFAISMGVYVAGRAGVLGVAVVMDEINDTGSRWSLLEVAAVLLASAGVLGLILRDVADTTNARNGIARDLLNDRPVPALAESKELLRHYRPSRRRHWTGAIALGMGAASSVAGIAAAVPVAYRLEVWSWKAPEVWILLGGLVVYVAGLWLVSYGWGRLVQERPKVPALGQAGAGRASAPGQASPWVATVATAFVLGRWSAARAGDEDAPA